MEKSNDISSKHFIKMPNYQIGQRYYVNVTHVNNPRSFYVRPTPCIDLKTLEEPGKLIQIDDLSSGSIIVYKSKTSNRYVRGIISFVNKENCKSFNIFAIDYGYFDTAVVLKNAHLPKIEFAPLAKHCRLANCAPNGQTFSKFDTDSMKIYIGKERCIMFIKSVKYDQMVVELWNSCPNDIATMLALTNFTNLDASNCVSVSKLGSIEPTIASIPTKSFEVNDTMFVRVLKKEDKIPNQFYVADVDDYKTYIKSRSSFYEYCQHQKNINKETLEVGKAVGFKVQNKNFYERGIVLTVSPKGTQALVSLIDTGECKEAVFNQMKDIESMDYFKTAGIAFPCEFVESEDTEKLLETLLTGCELWIQILEKGDPNEVVIVSKPD